MSSGHYLLVDGQGVRAYRWQRGRLQAEAEFRPDPAWERAADDYLLARPGGRFHVLVNLAEESSVQETLPPLNSRDKRHLIERRLTVQYPDQSLRLAQRFACRQDTSEHLLLYAQLTNPLLETWQGALRRTNACLVGIYPLAAVVAGFIAGKKRRPRQVIVVCPTRTGIRIVLTVGDRFIFSRLATNTLSSEAVVRGKEIATEVARTRAYLVSQQLLEADVALGFVGQALDFEAFQFALDDQAPSRAQFFDLMSCCKEPQACAGDSDLLWLTCLARQRPRQQLASADDRRHFRIERLRLVLRLATAALFAAASFASTSLIWQAQTLAGNTAHYDALRGENEQRLQAALTTLPPLPAKIETLLGLAELADAVERHKRATTSLIGHLAAALDRMPELQLQNLSWELSAGRGTSAKATLVARLALAGAEQSDPEQQIGAREQLRSLCEDLRGVQATTVDSSPTLGLGQFEVHLDTVW